MKKILFLHGKIDNWLIITRMQISFKDSQDRFNAVLLNRLTLRKTIKKNYLIHLLSIFTSAFCLFFKMADFNELFLALALFRIMEIEYQFINCCICQKTIYESNRYAQLKLNAHVTRAKKSSLKSNILKNSQFVRLLFPLNLNIGIRRRTNKQYRSKRLLLGMSKHLVNMSFVLHQTSKVCFYFDIVCWFVS